MLGGLEKVNEPHEPRTASECWSGVCELHFKKRGHDDMPGRQGVPTCDSKVRPLPKPGAAGDLSAADSIS